MASTLKVRLVDGQQSPVPIGRESIIALVGHCSAGTPLGIYPYGAASPTRVASELGRGALTEVLASLMTVEGHSQVVGVPVTPTTAGTISTVTQSGTGPLPTTAGSPFDLSYIVIEIISGGALGTSTYRVTLDGDSVSPVWSGAAVTAATLVTNGITVTFPAGTYVAGERYTLTTTAPILAPADVTAAIDKLRTTSTQFGHIHIVSDYAGATDALRAAACAAMFDAAVTAIETLAAANIDVTVSLDAPTPVASTPAGMTTYRAALRSAFGSKVSRSCWVLVGRSVVVSNVDTRRVRRPISTGILAKLSARPISEHLGQTDVALPFVEVETLDHNEAITGGLSDMFLTVQTHQGAPGAYVTSAVTFAGASSDYNRVHYIRMANYALRVGRAGLLRWLNKRLPAKPSGALSDVSAQGVDDDITDDLRNALVPAHLDDAFCVVDKEYNVRDNNRMQGTLSLRHSAYAEDIDFSVGYVRG